MANDNEPLIKLEPGGKAAILSYNIPEPTSYSGQNFIELEYPKELFTSKALERPGPVQRTPPTTIDPGTLATTVKNGMKTGFADQRLFPNVKLASVGLRFVDAAGQQSHVESSVPVSPKLAALDPDEVAARLQAGMRLNVYRSLFGSLTNNFIPEPADPDPHLYLVETYRLSSFLGTYGAGRIVKTFSLLPGEKTTISVKTYQRSEQDSKAASSILDSFTQESADDFENSVQQEQSDKQGFEKGFEYHADAEASGHWGWGSAKASGGIKGSTNSTREEFAKNVSSAVTKHSAKASAKRDVQINTSTEVKQETGEETAIQRTVENVNVSRTLNFVFRQMNQEFVTLLHLVDVRVAFFNGFAESRKEVPLPMIDSLLADYIAPEHQAQVRADILAQLQVVLDYQDEPSSVIEEKALSPTDKFTRFRRDLVSTYQDPITGTKTTVRGLILSVSTSVLRTEGVIVDAILGEGPALDTYASKLQEIEIERRDAARRKETAVAVQAELANTAVTDGDADRVKMLVDLTCPCKPAPGSPAPCNPAPGPSSPTSSTTSTA